MFFTRVKNLITLLNLYICQLLRQLKGEKFVHIIGDSHTLAFQHCALKVHYLGATTAYNLVNQNSSSGGREKLFKVINSLKKGETVLLVFGEIDARIHNYNQYMKKKNEQVLSSGNKVSIEKLINNVTRNYSQVIKEIKGKNFKVGVYNIVPPGPQGNIYNYPHYAQWSLRLKITKMMNEQLRNFCRKNGIFFVDIFDQVINHENISVRSFRRGKYIFDDVHLNDKVTKLVINELKSMGVLF